MSALVRRSFVGCPAPLAVEVVELARSFPGLGLAVVRPSSRAFSSWVCVCSFASELAAVRFAAAAAGQFFGPGSFCVVRFTFSALAGVGSVSLTSYGCAGVFGAASVGASVWRSVGSR